MRRSEAGFSLVAVAATTTMMLAVMGMAVPTWKYVMQNAREEELIFRGTQIAEAVERYQRKHGNAQPVSLDVLVKGKFLRKAYKDPMVESGQWRFVRPGEAGIGLPSPGGGVPGQPGASPGPTPRAGGASPSPSPSPSGTGTGTGAGSGSGSGSGSGAAFGPFIGVASTSRGKSLRIVNGRQRYDQWLFLAGQPVLVGKDAAVRLPPGVRRDNPPPRR